MKIQKEYHYTYYSYEEYGRGYIGSRTCKCLPEEDTKYFGSFTDKTFTPSQKMILKSDYATRAEADADEVLLHNYFEVDINPHFANRARQSSSKFRLSKEQATNNGKIGGQKTKKLGLGIFSLTPEEKSEVSKKSGQKNRDNKTGVCGLTLEQRTEFGKKGAEKCKELGLGIYSLTITERRKIGSKSGKKTKENNTGIFSLTVEQKHKNSLKGGQKTYELGVGLFALTPEQRIENARKSGKVGGNQKWQCTETGYISNAGGLTVYQKARGIDVLKRIRIK